MNQTLLNSLHQCLLYRNASPFAKPFLDPQRFLRNQMRQKFRPQPGSVQVIDTFHTRDFSIVAGEIVSEALASYGFMEPELTEAFLHLVKPKHVAVDIGMHLGYFTSLFATLVGSQGKVYSFEPTPSTREIAAFNTSKFENVSVYPNAVWSRQETMTFHDYGKTYMAFNSVTAARMCQTISTVSEHQVKSISLDEFRHQIDRPIDIIKIDAESAEEQILAGARELLQKDRPIVTVEVGDEATYIGRSRRLIQTLGNMGYVPWDFLKGAFRRHQHRDIYVYDNLIFAPADRPLE